MGYGLNNSNFFLDFSRLTTAEQNEFNKQRPLKLLGYASNHGIVQLKGELIPEKFHGYIMDGRNQL